ncbi:MAG TPA: hypothetical protein VEY09_06065 [Pyrinomonadaceae bacterium]|nr:hypothetical protein [Pyrinomonadaceae bacterium]
MSRRLDEPILDRGIGHTNFFDGRLLTADDLRNDQNANRERRRQLGRAAGSGVIEGLEVSLVRSGEGGDRPVLAVRRGLALARSGRLLSLGADDQVRLTRQEETRHDAAGLFAECGTTGSVFTHLENGFYVLFLCPASGYSGSAPVQGLGGGGQRTGACGGRYEVEGVRFRLAPFDVFASDILSRQTLEFIATLADAPGERSDSLLRNLLAHACFGTEESKLLALDPLRAHAGGGSERGALDYLRRRGLSDDCEVALALVYWRGGRVRFVDNWAVRRRVARVEESECWAPFAGDRAAAEREAMLCQFRDHLSALLDTAADPSAVVARSYFHYVPPVALVPLAGGAGRGFAGDTFFEGLPRRGPEFIRAAALRSLLGEAAHHEPVEIGAPARRLEMLWLYLVAESEMARDAGAAVRRYAVLASGHTPHRATARFDLSLWDYANYAGEGEG